MNIKKEFIIRNIAGNHILVPIGETALNFNGLITMNDVGVFIWNNLDCVNNESDLLNKILNEYEVEESVAKSDMEEFLGILKKEEII